MSMSEQSTEQQKERLKELRKHQPSRTRREPTVCKGCGVTFMALVRWLKQGKGLYCSRKCCAEDFKKRGVFKGENNPRWLGGVSNDNMRYNRRQAERQPERVAARQATMKAIASGRLVRQPCEVCGTTEKVEAHHDDYTKALEVRWLCVTHHDEHHANERRLKRAQRAAAGQKVPRLRKYRPRVKPDTQPEPAND